jgi:hypothetical protein
MSHICGLVKGWEMLRPRTLIYIQVIKYMWVALHCGKMFWEHIADIVSCGLNNNQIVLLVPDL